jgi:hypothetical protein
MLNTEKSCLKVNPIPQMPLHVFNVENSEHVSISSLMLSILLYTLLTEKMKTFHPNKYNNIPFCPFGPGGPGGPGGPTGPMGGGGGGGGRGPGGPGGPSGFRYLTFGKYACRSK